jgi:acetyl-CoA carboxylase carboxyl transferase subunit beta
MGWLSREPAKLQDVSEKKSLPSGVWEKCPSCSEIILISDLEENHLVCPTCNYHHRLPGEQRIELLIDNNTFFEWDHTLCSTDPLNFDDGRAYQDRLKNMIKKTYILSYIFSQFVLWGSLYNLPHCKTSGRGRTLDMRRMTSPSIFLMIL